ncbi:MAG: hypothetical protein R3B37_06065 [Nitrospira sp.]|nr:hypothetical protein [Nitrospira sp.]
MSALCLAKGGQDQAEISHALGFSQGTVSRELARNTGRRGYRFQQAQRSAQARQQQVRHQSRKLTSGVRRALIRKLRAERWSPKQPSFWLRNERGLSLSPEWIYQMIWANKRMGGDLWRFLRRRGKRYNQRGAQHAGRGVIPLGSTSLSGRRSWRPSHDWAIGRATRMWAPAIKVGS